MPFQACFALTAGRKHHQFNNWDRISGLAQIFCEPGHARRVGDWNGVFAAPRYVPDAEALSADDDGAGACGDLRAAVVSDVTARATKLARLTTHTQTAAVPTLTIAARLYDDAERADEIATRNRIVHPLFARGDLRVLSS